MIIELNSEYKLTYEVSILAVQSSQKISDNRAI